MSYIVVAQRREFAGVLASLAKSVSTNQYASSQLVLHVYKWNPLVGTESMLRYIRVRHALQPRVGLSRAVREY